MNRNKGGAKNVDKISTLEHDLLKNKAILMAIVFLFLYVISLWVEYSNPSWQNDCPVFWGLNRGISNVLLSLFATAIAVALLSIAIEKSTKETFIEHMRNAVVDSLFLDDNSINTLKTEHKYEVLSKISKNLVNNSALVDYFISTLKKSAAGWRSDFKYEAKLRVNSATDQGFRYTLLQDLSYIQNYTEDLSQLPDERIIRIGFAYSEEKLDEWLKDDKKEWFFREIIYDKYTGHSDAELRRYIEKTLEFKLSVGNERSDGKNITNYSINCDNNTGVIIEYSHKKKANNFFAQVTFKNNRRDKHWLVTLPTLTQSAIIRLNVDESKVKVDGYDFFTCNNDVKPSYVHGQGRCQYGIEHDQWLFPVSGVMFVWDEKPLELVKNEEGRQ